MTAVLPEKNSCNLSKITYYPICPNRTCLWSCVGRRETGQEAGAMSKIIRQPEANRRTPFSAEDRDLKQRRTGLFRLCWFSKDQLIEEASLSCRACGSGVPFPIEGCSIKQSASTNAGFMIVSLRRITGSLLRELETIHGLLTICSFVAFPSRVRIYRRASNEAYGSRRGLPRPSKGMPQ